MGCIAGTGTGSIAIMVFTCGVDGFGVEQLHTQHAIRQAVCPRRQARPR
jgi:hypothetical protein